MPILRDWTDSQAVDKLSVHAERFFCRLLQKCDDYGRFHADPRLLTSMLFPLKRDARDTDQTRSLDECERAGLVRCYVDRQGRQLLQVVKWKDDKKFKRSSFDPPPGEIQITLEFVAKKSPRPEVEIEVEEKGKLKADSPALRKRELWQLLKDEQSLSDRIKHEKERTKPDSNLIASLQAKRQKLREEMKL